MLNIHDATHHVSDLRHDGMCYDSVVMIIIIYIMLTFIRYDMVVDDSQYDDQSGWVLFMCPQSVNSSRLILMDNRLQGFSFNTGQINLFV